MRIDDLRQERVGDWVTVSARINWEERRHPPQRICFEVAGSLAEDVECSPNAFLTATAVPAGYYGERRVAIEGKVCPALVDGVLTILTQHREWYDKKRSLPTIEPSRGFETRTPCVPSRAAEFFSGGIDALSTLRRNRLMYPANHPSSIRDCLHIFGMHPLDYADGTPCPVRLGYWERNLELVRKITRVADVELHLMRTNVHGIFTDQILLANEYFSTTLLSLGQLLTRRIDQVFIASSDYLGDLKPFGSHPMIDPYYSSSALRVLHDGAHLRRIDKVRLISEWPEALSMLNVCINWDTPQFGANCGKCSKCVRTMIELLICGRLQAAVTFPIRQVDAELIRGVRIRTSSEAAYYRECLEALEQLGRRDLIEAIENRLAEFRALVRRKAGHGWKAKIRKLDSLLFGGRLREKWHARQAKSGTVRHAN